MNNLLVSDTNIFIDLINGGLLDDFFKLPYSISTNLLIIGEITDNKQLEQLKPFLKNGKLKVENVSATDFDEIYSLKTNASSRLSFNDCSVWYSAKKINARLLTGDSRLRKAVEKDGLKVSGILFVLDKIEEHSLVSSQKLQYSLLKIISKNKQSRLPVAECNKRLNCWAKGLSFTKSEREQKKSMENETEKERSR